ncbi:MAG: rhodanese-like domain-containing protein [Porticoccaceae bacterium]|nr:rhodanese-like domain-containing protein [Porticoccaceae bacterium]
MHAGLKNLLILSIFFSNGAFSIDNNTTIIDVRSIEEWASGHLVSAQHLQLELISEGITDLVEDKDQAIYVYCRSGNRSGQAKLILDAMGYNDVTNAGSLQNASDLLDQDIVY